MLETIKSLLQSSIDTKTKVLQDAALLAAILNAAQRLSTCLRASGTVYSCGNGGSSCDAMHFTEELVARYKRERPGLRAQHFHDAGTITCWANDYAYEDVFARQVRTFCGAQDVLLAISTSGNSKNVIAAATAARERKTCVIGLLGKGGGALASHCDIPIIVPADTAERIQEVHITIIHIWCELLETSLLP
jgi:D-sedoheptulose 7-phosphate isomerase